MEQTFNWKRLFITLFYVLLTAGVIGGTTWYFMDKNAKADKEQYDRQIRELEQQRDQKATTKASTATAKAVNYIFDILTVKAGDTVGNMRVVSATSHFPERGEKIAADNAIVVFSGEATVTGTYEYSAHSDFFDAPSFTFKVANTVANKLPTIKGPDGTAVMMFLGTKMQPLKTALSLGSVDKTGTVTLRINNYQIRRCGCEDTDTANILSVIK